MTADDVGRPQDQGRRHRRRSRPSAETASLLVEYQDAMRSELRAVLTELQGTMPDAGLLADVPTLAVRPSLADRMKLWDLAIKIGRELGTEVDKPAAIGEVARPTGGPTKGRRIDFG